MEVARDLKELKRLISQLGLKDERRQSPRYNVEIAGTYTIEAGKPGGPKGTCLLVDVSKEGLSLKLYDKCITAGTILYLELPMSGKTVGVSTRIVHVQPEKDSCFVGLKSTGESDDIIQQLFSSQA